MFRYLFISLFLFSKIFCINPASPQDDGRFARSKYISSFIKEGDVGAEIGVNEGQFAYFCLSKLSPKKLFLIDPWRPWAFGTNKDYLDKQYQRVCDYFSNNTAITVIRKTSVEASYLFEDASLDYVYIDAEHSYKAVMEDLTHYLPKIKNNGYIMGDDYGWEGVGAAVLDFVKLHSNELTFINNPYDSDTGGQYILVKHAL